MKGTRLAKLGIITTKVKKGYRKAVEKMQIIR
jgi:hypothetical protein